VQGVSSLKCRGHGAYDAMVPWVWLPVSPVSLSGDVLTECRELSNDVPADAVPEAAEPPPRLG
jgi:hypothetical protein